MCSSKRSDAVIIGAGISGLVAAYRLWKQGVAPIVVDPNPPGGLIQTKCVDGFTLELGPNVFVLKESLRDLLQELDLENEIVPPRIDNYLQEVWWNGQSHAVPKKPGQLLSSRLLSFGEKIILLRTLFSRLDMPEGTVDESVAQFVGRLIGSDLTGRILDPVLQGIYGGDISQLSARSIFPNLWQAALEKRTLRDFFSSKSRPGIGVISGGNETLVNRLVSSLREEQFVKDKVINVTAKDQQFEVHCEGGESLRTDRVIVATSGGATAGYLDELDPDLSKALEGIRYAKLLVVHLGLENEASLPQNSFGVLFPRTSNSQLLGVMYNSSLFPHVAPKGKGLACAMFGGVGREPEADISKIPGLENSNIISTKLWERAIPQYELGHWKIVQQMERVEASFPGLQFIGADRGGIGVADRVAAAFTV